VTAAGLQKRAEAVAAGLPALLLRAKRLAAAVNVGAHGRRRPGSGDDFWQFRHSQPGDALTAIDWRQSGKSDHLYIREKEWTIAHTTRMWVDPSASMRWSKDDAAEEKYERACLLAVATGYLLEQAGERLGLLGQPGPAFYGRTAPTRLALALECAGCDDAWPSHPVPPRGTLLVFSDFLQPLAAIEAGLKRWSAAGMEGHLLQVLDPAEETLPFSGRVRLRGLESEGEMLLPNAESLRADYGRAMAEQRAAVQALARHYGWSFTLHHTDRPAREALTHLYAALARG
jgi:uncharacterized protein (DUF58 family)